MQRFPVLEQPRYITQIRKTESEEWKSDVHRDTVKHVLARHPLIGKAVSPSADLYIMHITREFEGLNPIAIFYLFDGETVSLEEAFVDTSEED